MGTVMGYVW